MEGIISTLLGPIVTLVVGFVVNAIRKAVTPSASGKVIMLAILGAVASGYGILSNWLNSSSALPWYMHALLALAATFIYETYTAIKEWVATW
jgi:hypothetical protein